MITLRNVQPITWPI